MAGTLYFSATDTTAGVELFKSDGTAAGTQLVADIYTGGIGSNPRNLTEMSGAVYFIAGDSTRGDELWRSNGTAAGTVLVKDIRAGSQSSQPFGNLAMVNVGGTLFFQANDGTSGYELWKSDGTRLARCK